MVFTSKAETLAWCCSGLLLAQIQLAGETAIAGKCFINPWQKLPNHAIGPRFAKKAAGTIDRPAAFDCFTPAGGARWRHVLSGKAI
jgi:hypothetical protein